MISLVGRSARNKISDVHRLEATADLLPALDSLHEFIQLMQGERNTVCSVHLRVIQQKLSENRCENGLKRNLLST